VDEWPWAAWRSCHAPALEHADQLAEVIRPCIDAARKVPSSRRSAQGGRPARQNQSEVRAWARAPVLRSPTGGASLPICWQGTCPSIKRRIRRTRTALTTYRTFTGKSALLAECVLSGRCVRSRGVRASRAIPRTSDSGRRHQAGDPQVAVLLAERIPVADLGRTTPVPPSTARMLVARVKTSSGPSLSSSHIRRIASRPTTGSA
jgi:hypothetical protein